MAMSAQEIVASIACDEATFNQSPEKFSGFVRKVTSSRVDFYWKDAAPGKPDEMTINRRRGRQLTADSDERDQAAQRREYKG